MWNRVVVPVVAAIVLVAVLAGIDLLVLSLNNPSTVLKQSHYYMALGDSLTFGYQPNLNFTDGFADTVFQQLRSANITEEINLACAGETTTSMIQGGCIGRFAHHGSYTGAQLNAALDFLQDHPGRVSPVTLEIGANDILGDWLGAVCQPSASATTDLAKMDANLTQTILPRLTQALTTVPAGMNGTMGGMATAVATNVRSGDLVMLNYYNPFAQECPNSAPFVHMFNQHLAADAAKFGVPVVDIYSAFGGDAGMATNVCQGPIGTDGLHHPFTWICTQPYLDFHPTTTGYGVMAKAVDYDLGYPNSPAIPGVAPLGRAPLPAAFRAGNAAM